MTAYYKDNGVWKPIDSVYVKVAGAWKTVPRARIKISSAWKVFHSSLVIPTGAIVPYYSDGSIPTGWSLYTSGNRILRGWDGTLGGIGVLAGGRQISFTSVSDPNHLGSTAAYFVQYISSTYNWTLQSSFSNGGHSHACVDDASSKPAIMETQLIQADSVQSTLPANAVVFGSSLPDLDEIATSGQFIQAGGSSPGSLVSAVDQSSVTTDTVGAHRHNNYSFPFTTAAGTCYRHSTSAGGHSHSFNLSNISWEIKKKFLKAFTAIAEDFPMMSGAILGWEGNTPPAGYVMCDGNNGTLDLRGYSLCLSSSETPGTTGGDDTVTANYNTGDGGSHHHKGTTYTTYLRGTGYHGDNRVHSHIGSIDKSQYYPYITLSFIQAV